MNLDPNKKDYSRSFIAKRGENFIAMSSNILSGSFNIEIIDKNNKIIKSKKFDYAPANKRVIPQFMKIIKNRIYIFGSFVNSKDSKEYLVYRSFDLDNLTLIEDFTSSIEFEVKLEKVDSYNIANWYIIEDDENKNFVIVGEYNGLYKFGFVNQENFKITTTEFKYNVTKLGSCLSSFSINSKGDFQFISSPNKESNTFDLITFSQNGSRKTENHFNSNDKDILNSFFKPVSSRIINDDEKTYLIGVYNDDIAKDHIKGLFLMELDLLSNKLLSTKKNENDSRLKSEFLSNYNLFIEKDKDVRGFPKSNNSLLIRQVFIKNGEIHLFTDNFFIYRYTQITEKTSSSGVRTMETLNITKYFTTNRYILKFDFNLKLLNMDSFPVYGVAASDEGLTSYYKFMLNSFLMSSKSAIKFENKFFILLSLSKDEIEKSYSSLIDNYDGKSIKHVILIYSPDSPTKLNYTVIENSINKEDMMVSKPIILDNKTFRSKLNFGVFKCGYIDFKVN